MHRALGVRTLTVLLVAVLISYAPGGLGAPATARAVSLPDGVHWVGVRTAAGGGTELFDRRDDSVFVPRGVNLEKEEPQSTGPYPVLDMLVAPGAYDDTWTRAKLSLLAKAGYNTVRVFLDHCPGACLTNPDGSAKQAWLDNVTALLVAAQDRGIAVLLTSNELPEVGYADQLPYGGVFDGGFNATILSPRGIGLTLTYWRTVIGGLQARGAPLEVVAAYELLNETFFELDRNPLALVSGLVTAANGITYDMANAASRDSMVDEGLVHWAHQAASTIRALDPGALVTAGFFGPIPGTRLVRTAYFVQNAAVDFIDIHHYPSMSIDFAQDIAAMGLVGYQAKPVILGEFGAFRLPYPDARAAANGLAEFQAASCLSGVDGWLTWAMGSLDASLYGVDNGKRAILKTISPVKRPDPCASTGYAPNLALGRAIDATAQLPGFEADHVVDGLAQTAWTSGSLPPASITIDFGGPMRIREVRLLVAQFQPGPTVHTLEVRSATGAWKLVRTFAGWTEDGLWLRFVPGKPMKNLRYLRVTTTSSPFWAAWSEIQAY